jgi:hypothetical protein
MVALLIFLGRAQEATTITYPRTEKKGLKLENCTKE